MLKGCFRFQIKLLINNFDLKVSAVKLVTAVEFSSRIRSVNLPRPEDEVSLGYLASILAWTPNGVSYTTSIGFNVLIALKLNWFGYACHVYSVALDDQQYDSQRDQK